MIKKFLGYAVGNFITLIIGIITTSVITRLILPEEMGKYSLFITTTTLLYQIAVLGLDQSYVRFYNEEKSGARSSLLYKCLHVALVSFVFVAMFCLLFYRQISMLIFEKIDFQLVLLFAINILMGILIRYVLLEVRMNQKVALYSAYSILQKLFYLIFSVCIFIALRNDCRTLMIAYILAQFFVIIASNVYKWFCKKKVESEKLKCSFSLKELFKYGYPFIFSMAITWIFQATDKYSIRILSDYYELGLYSGALNIISLLNTCQMAFTTFWIPVSYEKYEKLKDASKEFFVLVNEYISFGMLLIAVLLVMFKEIIILFLGNDYREAVYIFPFLIFMPIMYTISETTVIGINFLKKSKAHIGIACVSAVFNIIGNMILVPLYGAKGAAISTGLAYIIFFGMRTFVSEKHFKVAYKLKKFVINVVIAYIYAVYASFNSINVFSIIFGMIAILVLCISYKNILSDLERRMKLLINKKK